MPRLGYTPEVQDQFRGEFTLPGNAQCVPAPYSPACQNVQFYPGRVTSRPGLTTVATFTGAKVVSLKEYVTLDSSQKRTLALTSDGSLWSEPGTFTYSLITNQLVEASLTSSLQMNSVTQFGREYMGFSTNGRSGIAVPQAWNDVNLDRVAPSGPGGGVILAAAAGGAITIGTHQIRVLFITRNGFITAPSQVSTAIAFDGTQKANVTVIPTGPSWVVGRIICMTPACNTTSFYYVPGTAMVLNDNTTTTTSFSLTDTALIAGLSVSAPSDVPDDMLRLIELPPQATSFAYHGRIAWLGERNSLIRNGDVGFQNLSFDGGFAGNLPRGWSERFAGESKGVVAGSVGDCLLITGNGTNTRGQLENVENAQPILTPGTEIRARVRMKKSAGAGTTPTFNIYLVPAATGNAVSGMQVTAAQMSATEWRVLDGQVLTAAQNTPDSTWRLRISTGGTEGGGVALPNNETMAIDYIELYPGNAPKNSSIVRWSRALQPDAYDGLFGLQTIGENNGQDNTNGFVLGDNAYICKERSLFITHDDGFNEPVQWPVSQISSIFGTPSAKGAAVGDQWVIGAGRAGLWYFDGGRPESLSEDIRPTWNRINWQYGHTIWVRVDPERRRITVGVPLDSATAPTTTIGLDYYGDTPLQSRNYNRWFTGDGSALLCAVSSERPDGTKLQLVGTDHANGLIAKWDDAAHSDFASVAINSRYQFHYMGGGTGRNLWGSLSANVYGSGTLGVDYYLPDGLTVSSTRGPTSIQLASSFKTDVEWPAIGITSERISWEVFTNAVGDWWSLQKFSPWSKPKPWSHQSGKRGA